MERVSIVHGRAPVVLVAPHGFDDTYTDIFTEHAAIAANCNAVINHGWERSKVVDVLNDKANCNNIQHVCHNVVKDEFYDPIWKMIGRLRSKHKKIYVFHIHGCGNNVRNQTGHNLNVIIGYGKGEPGKSRPTCDTKTVNIFSYILDSKSYLTAQAESGSKFAGWDRENLLQLWRGHSDVCAMQLEFVTAVRKSKLDAKFNGNHFGDLIKLFLTDIKTIQVPPNYNCLTISI